MEYINRGQNKEDNPKLQIKKKLRANDSLSKYKKKNPQLIKKQNIELNSNNEDLPLQYIKPQLTETSTRYKEKDNFLKKDEKNVPSNTRRRTSFLIDKYNLLRAYTPKRDFRRKNLYSNLNNKSFYKTSDHFSDLYNVERNNKLTDIRRPFYRSRIKNYSKPNFNRINTEFTINTERNNRYGINENNYIRENIRAKEIITLNNILNKQYNELKVKTKEMKYQINDLMTYQQKLTINNQNLKTENARLLMNLTNLKTELDNSINDLESKNNIIEELSENINNMKNDIIEKDNIIANLKNNIGYNVNQNQNYNQNEELIKLNHQKDNQINNLINQINDWQKKYKYLFNEKQKKEKILNQKLIQGNKKYQNLFMNFKKEQENNKNNYAANEQKQKMDIDNLVNQYEMNINELNEKINIIQEENNNLKITNQQQNKEIYSLIGEKNKLLDEITNLNNLLKQSTQEIKINESIRNNMKIDIEKKNNESEQLSILSQSNKQLQATINTLKNQISILEKEKEKLMNNNEIKEYNMNNNFQDNKELEDKIAVLNREKEDLQNKLINYLNSETNSNNKINRILQEKNELTKENTELKNEIKELENENRQNILQLSNYSEIQKELESLKKENITNFNELKLKHEETQKLYNIIKDKERENQLLKKQISNNIGNEGREEKRDYRIDSLNVDMNNELEEKKIIIEKLEKQINNIKNMNEKITMENSELKEKLQLIQSGKDEGYINTLDNLKDELKDTKQQIKVLIEENKNLRNKIENQNDLNNINNINNNEKEKEIDLNKNNKYESNPFRTTMNSQGLTDADKIKLYRERIKQCEQTNESDKVQIQALKDDIKEKKNQIKELQTFGGQVKDMIEFIFLLRQALLNYKPKKQEQKDALNKIIDILNNFQGIKP